MEQARSQATPTPQPIQRIAEAMIKVLGLERSPVTEARLRKLIRGRKQYKTAALRQLIRESRVLRFGAGTKGDPFRYSVTVRSTPISSLQEIIL